MSEALRLLAEKKFGTLDPAERKFFQAVAERRPADFSVKVQAENDPAQARKWGDERALRADRIAELFIDPEAVSLIPHNRGIAVKGARIDGDLDLRSITIPFPLIFERCAFVGNVNLNNCKICVLDFSGSHVCSIDCTGSEVENGIFLSNDFRSNGIVCLEGTKVTGPLDCTGAHFLNPGNTALDADRIEVTGDVLLRNGFMAEGMVSLVGTTIKGNLECNKGVFINKGKVAINAERLNVDGDVFLCQGSWGADNSVQTEGFRAEGEVKLVRAAIAGDLDCVGGKFCNSDDGGARVSGQNTEWALRANGLNVKGSMFLSEGFRADGKVDLVGTTIGGNLECNSGEFINRGDVALDAERVKVDGDVFLCEGCWRVKNPIPDGRFKAIGKVKLIGAAVGGSVTCKGASFASETTDISSEVSLYGATINRELVWIKIVSPEQVKLDLRFAKVVKLSDDAQSWPAPGNLLLDGLVYDEIGFDMRRFLGLFGGYIEECDRIRWLRLQDEFCYQPYEQLVAILRRRGRDNDVRTVLIAKEMDLARLTNMRFFERCWQKFLGITIGYGYLPWRALKIAIVVILLGTAIFWAGHKKMIILPTKDERPQGEFNALMYSLDMFIPLVDLGQAAHWLPSTESTGGLYESEKLNVAVATRLLRLYMWYHILAGWVLTPLVPLGLRGLVKR